MSINKNFTIVLVFVFMLIQAEAAMAGNVQQPQVDLSNDAVTITGKTPSASAGRTVTLLVLNPNKDLGSLTNDGHALQKQSELLSSDGGAFIFSFPIYYQGGSGSGRYKVYVGGDDFNTPEELSFYFTVPQDRESLIDDINKSENAAKALENLNKYADELSLHSTVFDSIDKTSLAQRLYSRITALEFDTKNAGIFQKWIKEQALVEAYNQSLTDVVYGNTGDMLYMDVLQFNNLDTSRNLTVYSTYINTMNDEGRASVRRGLLGNACANIEALRSAFIQQVVINGIKHAANGGFGHVHDLLCKNGAAAGLNLTAYNALDNSGDVDSRLVDSDFNTIAELQNKIDQLIMQGSQGNVTGGRGAGGTRGGGDNFSVGSSPVPVTSPAEQTVYNDMEGAEWAIPFVSALAKRGIINGMGDGSFKPNQSVTREQFAKMLTIALGLEISDSDSGFPDVANNAWYAPYITSLKKYGIVKGKDSGFGIGENITRQDVAVMVYRGIVAAGLNIGQGTVNVSFNDADSIAAYARDAVAFLATAGVVNGMGNGSFEPQGICTRAQAAKIIYQLIK